MSTEPDNFASLGPEWNARPVMVFAGQEDTHIHSGEDYETRTLASLFVMEPDDRPKGQGLAFIPSTYHDYDGRNHAIQREKGDFVALTGDIDKGDHALARIEGLVRGFCGDSSFLIYSSAHARPGDRRWRVIIPLEQPVWFNQWHDAQQAFFAFMEFSGVEMDHALARAGQPVYLPNVPPVHEKSGEALRSDDGAPLFFQRATSGTNSPGLALDQGAVSAWLATLKRRQEEDNEERERIRKEAEARRARQPAGDGANIIAEFNRGNSLATMLELYNYERSPRNPDDWRSRYQTGGTYATRVIGDKWVSLSQSDASARVGEQCKSGCYGDAYDLFVHYEHGGDHKAAFRALHAERKAAEMRYQPDYIPERDEECEIDPETGQPIFEDPGYGEDEPKAKAEQDAPPDDILPVFHPADWQDQAPPGRQWRWDAFVPNFQATLLTGAGAAGKSLATQQMCTCVALGLPFLGVETRQSPALYITCEDDLEELHRRQDAICAALGVQLEQTRGKLFLLSLQGQIGNELAIFDGDGKMTLAPRYHEIEQTCLALGVKHATLDNTAHTFAGNENDRHQVAAFVNLNNRLAKTIGGSVVMVGHPNKAGNSYSGSTAWENQVRARLYLEVPKGEEGAPVDPDMRVLRNEKANYSQRGAEVHFWWFKGAFVTEKDMPEGSDGSPHSAQAEWEDNLFLDLLVMLTKQRRHVSHAANLSNYAPKIMAGMPEARGVGKANFARAMERLFAADLLLASQPLWKGSNRHPVLGLARKQ